MTLLGASFQIGRSALSAYQAAISVAGQNIANVANPDYARQTGRLTSLVGGPTLRGVQPGGGVNLSALSRKVNEAIEHRLRVASGDRARSDVVYRALTETETLYNELSEQDVSTLLSQFFASFGQLESAPQDQGARSLVLAAGDQIVHTLQRHREGLLQQVDALNNEATSAIEELNRLSTELAALNQHIVTTESDGVTIASALRDRRDALLRELGDGLNITVREHANSAISVYLGSEPLVVFDRARQLVAERTFVNGLEVVEARYADSGGTAIVQSGRLTGVLTARDEHIRDQLDRLDTLARGLIYEVNRIHATGVGTQANTTLRGNFAVDDPNRALNLAGLPFPIENGSLIVKVRDKASGQIVTRQIEVDLDGIGGDTTLAGLAAALDEVPGLAASVTVDRRLQLDAEAGREFWFAEDSGAALAALGVGGFFSGVDAESIAVEARLKTQPGLIATSLSGALADGSNAGRLALLASNEAPSALLGGRSIADYQASMVGVLAAQTSQSLSDWEAADAIHLGLTAQRESVSGVNLDEEAIRLTQYERAYQGAARYLTVLDEMASELLTIL